MKVAAYLPIHPGPDPIVTWLLTVVLPYLRSTRHPSLKAQLDSNWQNKTYPPAALHAIIKSYVYRQMRYTKARKGHSARKNQE